MKFIKKEHISLYIIILLSVCFFCIPFFLLVNDDNTLGADIIIIPENLKLKVNKEDILANKIIDLIEIKSDGSVEKVGEEIKYLYKTNKIISKRANEDLSKRTHNSIHYITNLSAGNKKTYNTDIYLRSKYYKINNEWYEIGEATTTVESFNEQTKLNTTEKILRLFGNKAIAVDYTVNSADTRCYRNNQATWDLAHNGSTAVACSGSPQSMDQSNYSLFRAWFPFDTSGIPSGATIDSSVLHVYAGAIYTAEGTGQYYSIVQTTQASLAPTTSEWDTCGSTHSPTAGGSAVYSSILANSWNTITMDATGRGWVKTSGDASSCNVANTGWTCLGIRTENDFDDTSSGGTNGTYWGDGNAYLRITYTAGGGGGTVGDGLQISEF